jgi:hypothetical protein
MNCNQAIELLPWLLNGSLREDERREVREHLLTCLSCRDALADTQKAWEIFDQHVPASALVAHAAGERPEGIDPAVLQAHLEACPECSSELELVRMGRRLTEDESIATFGRQQTPRTSPRTVSSGWRAAALAAGLAGVVALNGWYQSAEKARVLDHRLAEAAAPAPAPQAQPPGAPSSQEGGERVAELQTQLDQMKKTVDELQTAEAHAREQLAQIAEQKPAAGPQINTWIGDVGVSGDVVRGATSTAPTDVPAKAAVATLLLQAGTGAQGDRDIEITDAQGRVVWKAEGLRLDPVGQDYVLTLHRGDLAPGSYTLQLYRRDGGQRAAAESYAVRVK